MIHGIRMGRVDIRTPAVALMFSRDGSLLVVATQVSRAVQQVAQQSTAFEAQLVPWQCSTPYLHNALSTHWNCCCGLQQMRVIQ